MPNTQLIKTTKIKSIKQNKLSEFEQFYGIHNKLI